MAATPTVYVICDKNCKFEGMTKEQILTAIMQAVNEGTIGDIDAGFITTIKTINGTPLKFFVGEKAEYDALTDEEKENLFAIITNDTNREGINYAIEKLNEDVTAALEAAADANKRLDNEYAKLSSTYTQAGTASSGYPKWDFDKGTILTYRVKLDVYADEQIWIGDIIDGGVVGTIAINRTAAAYAFPYDPNTESGDFADVIGTWRVCGVAGYIMIDGEQHNYWIIQRV